MAGNASASRLIASRYADALFSLAKEAKKAPKIGEQLEDFVAIITKNKALYDAIHSPLTSHDAMGEAAADIAKAAGADDLLVKAASLMGKAGRLRHIEKVLTVYQTRMAEENDIVIATVMTPKALKAAKKKKLEANLKEAVGKDVSLNAVVDDNMLGGMIIKVGSKMLDYSVRGRLAALQTQLHQAA